MITLYGAYGDFKNDLLEISRILRNDYGFENCKLVLERGFRRRYREDKDVYIAKKSFHYLEKSNVIVFVFFCDNKDQEKIAHGESPATELAHLINNITHKTKCCFILRQKGCCMARVLLGQIKLIDDVIYDCQIFMDNNSVAKIIQAKCRSLLDKKYYEI